MGNGDRGKEKGEDIVRATRSVLRELEIPNPITARIDR